MVVVVVVVVRPTHARSAIVRDGAALPLPAGNSLVTAV